jgi:hypothetical protein
MSEPGTRIIGEETAIRQLECVRVEELTLTWNDTDRISVDYRAGGVDMPADPVDCTSFDEPLDDEELLELLAIYGVHGMKLVSTDPRAVLEEMLDVAAGMLSEHDREGIALVVAMLDAVLDEDAKAARPATEIVADLLRNAA